MKEISKEGRDKGRKEEGRNEGKERGRETQDIGRLRERHSGTV